MEYFTESNHLLSDPPALRQQFNADGYLFFRDTLPQPEVLSLRRQILEFCQEEGWLRKGTDVMDGLTDIEPILEGDKEWRPVYAKIQALESFHRLKMTAQVHTIMEYLFQEPVFALPMTIARVAFPRDNERGTQPHQDWLYVGGSTETVSCWAPLGDVPVATGGLKLLKNSHKSGFLIPHSAPGPGGNTVDVDADSVWLQTDYQAGDILLFKSLTVHAAADNHTEDVIRLSIDFRYTGYSHTISDSWLQPHFHWLGAPFDWETLQTDWRDSPTANYWQHIPNLKVKPHHGLRSG